MRDRNWRPEGGEWEPIKISLEIDPSISQNHHEPSRVLGEVWNSYGRAKPTQNTPRTCERKHGSERENLQAWQTRTGQTALSNRSDRSGWSSKTQTGQTGFRDWSDRLHPDKSQSKFQTANLEQTKSKFNETWRKASFLPQERILKRSHPKNIHSTRISG